MSVWKKLSCVTLGSLCFGCRPPRWKHLFRHSSFPFSSVFLVSKNKAQTKLASLAINPSLCPRPVGSAPARRRSFCCRPPLTTSWATHQLTAAAAAQWVKSKTHSFSDSLRRGRTGCSFNCLLSVSAPRTPKLACRKAQSISPSLAQLHWNCSGATFWSCAA